MRVVFLGNAPWSVPTLEALARSPHHVARVVTRVPRPAGRGSELRSTPVAEAARVLGLPLAEVESIRDADVIRAIASDRPDVLVVVAYGEILPHEVLELPSTAPVNVHFSLLPKLRGANPVRAALFEGLAETGVTTIRMDEGMDTGDILLQETEPVRDDDDAGSLGERLARLGGEVLVRTLERMAAGELTPVPQDERGATYAPKLRAEDRALRWSEDAQQLARTVRGLAPEPAATTRFRGSALKIYRTRASAGSGEEGRIVSVDADGFAVGTADGLLHVLDVGPEGKRRMSAAEFARGARPRPGESMD